VPPALAAGHAPCPPWPPGWRLRLQKTVEAGDYCVLEELLQHTPRFDLSKRALARLLAVGAANDLDLQVRCGAARWACRPGLPGGRAGVVRCMCAMYV